MTQRVTLLCGGVGGAKLALGFYQELPPERLTVVTNTGDDIVLFGLHISPDTDIVIYTLGGRVNAATGWGVTGDGFEALGVVRELGGTGWFNLGDRDLGLHLYRTERIRAGAGLGQVTEEVAAAFGLDCTILPMCEQAVPTYIRTADGELHLQEYLVQRQAQPKVWGVSYRNIEQARPTPGVLEALAAATLVVLAPSNPLISIGPLLAVPGLREALGQAIGLRVAVSPLVGGRSLKGPTDRMLAQLDYPVSPVTVAKLYQDVLDIFVVDEVDAHHVAEIEALGLRCAVYPTILDSLASKRALARELLALERPAPRRRHSST